MIAATVNLGPTAGLVLVRGVPDGRLSFSRTQCAQRASGVRHERAWTCFDRSCGTESSRAQTRPNVLKSRVWRFTAGALGLLLPSPLGCQAPRATPPDEGPPLRSAPGVASYADGRLELFVEGNTRSIWRSTCVAPCDKEHGFGDWARDVGQPPAGVGSAPAAASWDTDRLDVFVLGLNDRAIWHQTWRGSRWLGWESLGGWLASAPAAVSFSAGRLDVFATDANGSIWHTWCAALGVPGCRGVGFSAWENIPGRPAPGAVGPPVVVTGGRNSFDLLVLGGDHAIWHQSYDNSWGAWQSFGGTFAAPPAVAARGGRSLDIFAVDGDGVLWRTSASRGSARPWKTVQKNFAKEIVAAPAADGESFVFARVADGAALRQFSCDANGRCRSVRD